jgi:hypothetical protein
MAFRLFNFHVDNDGVAELIRQRFDPARSGSKRVTSYRGRSLDNSTVGAIGGRTKAGNFDPISWVK